MARHYHDNATEFKRQRDEKVKELNLANETITDMTTRQRDVAALDAKYTGELADAKATIDQLERDVASGKRRLQLNARCPASGATGTGGMGDASVPDLLTPLNGIISPSDSESSPSPGKCATFRTICACSVVDDKQNN